MEDGRCREAAINAWGQESVKRAAGGDVKKGRTRLPLCCTRRRPGAHYLLAAGAAEAAAEAEAEAAFLCFLALWAGAEAEADIDADAAGADAGADADWGSAAKADAANREATRAAIILDMSVSFSGFGARDDSDESGSITRPRKFQLT
jgi:hypothetical protein